MLKPLMVATDGFSAGQLSHEEASDYDPNPSNRMVDR
jgi:hypothetical protein